MPATALFLVSALVSSLNACSWSAAPAEVNPGGALIAAEAAFSRALGIYDQVQVTHYRGGHENLEGQSLSELEESYGPLRREADEQLAEIPAGALGPQDLSGAGSVAYAALRPPAHFSDGLVNKVKREKCEAGGKASPRQTP